ncbi:MAG: polymer-forming cytoskeletal protein [Firmicutes bacterium]|nr:polymer-forming cytoskeletal protein [Bacillota bacterium]
MFKRGRQETSPDKVATLIGPETYLQGTVKSKGLMRIDGVMEGELETEGDVIVGEKGRALLDIQARNVSVAGYFKGSVELSGKLEIRSTGKVTGAIKAAGLVIDEGAFFSGSCEMETQAQGLEEDPPQT